MWKELGLPAKYFDTDGIVRDVEVVMDVDVEPIH